MVPASRRRSAGALLGAFCLLLTVTGVPASAGTPADAPTGLRPAAEGECRFPAPPLKGKPWALQRVMLDQLWSKSTGKGITVAVIDSGVDATNRQLTPALSNQGTDDFAPGSRGLVDENSHGTMAAGIIAARPDPESGFVGLAPESVVLSIRQNGGTDAQKGNVDTLVRAIHYAAEHGADVINISQETSGPEGATPGPALERAIRHVIDERDIVVVAAAGNSGDKDNFDTYPAKYEGVLAVGASDRNNDRAPFSQKKAYVDVLAPGVDMWSTVPRGGHCPGDGTSYAAPYAAGVAALVRAAHPDWTARQVTTVIQETAQRGQAGALEGSGWGVVDPLKAVTFTGVPGTVPVETGVLPAQAPPVNVAPLSFGPTRADRDRRTATLAAGAAFAAVLLVTSTAIVLRDARKRPRP
ncbi:MAG TPA: type VII secretion-associated serine protease mycosin [Yinghuangia sp.]|nr:type VII secretion-associated serine protease mycosin [Yinghuangia sp.]